MKQTIKVALIMDNNILDSQFVTIDDGLYADRPADYTAERRFLDTIEILRNGFSGSGMEVKLVPPSMKNSSTLFVPTTEWYEKKSRSLNEVLEKYASKIGVASPI